MKFVINGEKGEPTVELSLHRYSEGNTIWLEATSKTDPGATSVVLEILPTGIIMLRKGVSERLGFILEEGGIVRHSVGY